MSRIRWSEISKRLYYSFQGRGHQCDIRISDISVSRLHAFIKYEDGNFIIIDNNSKFGTLVKMNKKFEILSDKVAV